MKKNNVFLICLFFVFSCLFLKAENSAYASVSQTLSVGTNAEFAPFSFIENGKIVGFEIDLVQALCQKLGYQVKWKDVPFDALIPELKRGTIDCVATGMTITEERKQVVEFSNPYLQGSPLLVVYIEGKHHPCSVQDLKNFKIVVNEGYTADFYVTDTLHLCVLRLPCPTDAILALKSGRADVFITAENTLKPLAAAERNVTFGSFPIEGTSENCAIMLSKHNKELKEALNLALQQLEEEGVLPQLKKKWGLQS
ncbi:MAG: amino acid ABC transporter substrate-binding protein [Verrucomicrobia bacterium]|nr:amino acid ABC transporter substrate-binding protein [Verrucomicrobiota bacterium]